MAFSMLSEITAYYSIDKYIGDKPFFCLGRGWVEGGGGGECQQSLSANLSWLTESA